MQCPGSFDIHRVLESQWDAVDPPFRERGGFS